jgi:hypothetical protein
MWNKILGFKGDFELKHPSKFIIIVEAKKDYKVNLLKNEIWSKKKQQRWTDGKLTKKKLSEKRQKRMVQHQRDIYKKKKPSAKVHKQTVHYMKTNDGDDDEVDWDALAENKGVVYNDIDEVDLNARPEDMAPVDDDNDDVYSDASGDYALPEDMVPIGNGEFTDEDEDLNDFTDEDEY